MNNTLKSTRGFMFMVNSMGGETSIFLNLNRNEHKEIAEYYKRTGDQQLCISDKNSMQLNKFIRKVYRAAEKKEKEEYGNEDIGFSSIDIPFELIVEIDKSTS